ncbi:MAG: tRNA (adenosine(37)-N6)-dimethylallyltransferase MiaA [Desulfuromonadaceae bacterium]|nr:tRNA (adenosine(37)-N6)-dimethylallyltransferase MiaA [Desulfuromonadaceae bacterium]
MPGAPFKKLPPLVVILGPTASGKTDLSLRLADRFDLEIVSADSRQVYRDMDIGTAKPSAGERLRVPHHLLDVVRPDQPFNAVHFEKLGREAVAGIRGRGRVPFVVGGTGLYIKVLTEGLLEAPSTRPEIRENLLRLEKEKGEGTLHRFLRRVDPVLADRVFPRDLVRIVRGLEVFIQSGRPLSDFQRLHGFATGTCRTLKLGVRIEREELYRRIDLRVEAMLAAGLVEEAASLLEKGYGADLKAMQALGYRECLLHIGGRMSLAEVREIMKRETRRYAKRQMTWFNKDKSVVWLDSQKEFDRMLPLIEKFILIDAEDTRSGDGQDPFQHSGSVPQSGSQGADPCRCCHDVGRKA